MKISHLIIIVFVSFFVVFINIYADENISAYLDKSEILIGDILDFTVKAELEPNAQISANQNFNFDGFDIINSNIEHLVGKDNIYILKFKLLSIKTGNIIIDSVPVFFINPDGTNNLFFTPKQDIVVKSVLDNNSNQDIKDIKALQKIKLKVVYILLISIVVILTIIISYLFIFSWIRRPKNIIIDPKTKALNDLSLLYSNRNNVDIKEFYYKMSEILRTYISKKYNFYTLEMTTSEFFKKTKSLLPSDINVVEFKKYLTVFNLAKYASFTPNEVEIKKNYDFTKTLLEIL
ncbi:MAG: hypothetical protein LBI80_03160 [Endomicrobium sp.]|jgi:hypothetical protein|nr:hypothetical protein [Endomicrobium sp.]